ncbi:unnamed protein product [Mucor hiemalis]
MSNRIVEQFGLAVFNAFKKLPCQTIRRPQRAFLSTNPLPHATTEPTKQYNIRRTWSNADTEKLLKLVSKYGNKWKVFASYFPGRTSFCIRAHYFSVTHDTTRWTLEEKKILQRSLGSEKDPEKIDWEAIQNLLPKRRTIGRIKQFWDNSVQPSLNRGIWTKEESNQLKSLVEEFGTKWDVISKKIGTRSEDQCRNKWAYEVATMKKGEFSKQEDETLITGVQQYGVDAFHKIKEEMKSKRSVSQLRTRYNNFLDPEVDRSPWSEEEKKQASELFAELKNLRAVKDKMNSKRSIRDMYNQLRTNR